MKESTKAKVSVVIPVYNVEKYLAEALDSVVGQSLKDIEIICINDGSTDGGPAILEQYAAKDNRIRVYNQENKGLGATRNVGLSKATGEYVYFFDSDDKIVPQALESLYETASRDNLDMILFEADSFYESEELEEKYGSYKTLYRRKCEYPDVYTGKEIFVELNNNWEFIVSSCLKFHRREHLIENNHLFPEKIFFEDEYFSVEAILSAERVRVTDDVFFLRRVRDNSIITDPDKDYGKFVSYYKTAWMVLCYIAENRLSEEITRWLVYRVSSFMGKALGFYESLSDELKAKAAEDKDVPEMDWQKLLPVIIRCRDFYYEEKKHKNTLNALDGLREDIKKLKYDNQRYASKGDISSDRKKTGYEIKLEQKILWFEQEREKQREKTQELLKEKKERYDLIQELYKEKGERWSELQKLKKELREEKNKNKSLIAYKEKVENRAIVIPVGKGIGRILRAIKRRLRRLLGKP